MLCGWGGSPRSFSRPRGVGSLRSQLATPGLLCCLCVGVQRLQARELLSSANALRCTLQPFCCPDSSWHLLTPCNLGYVDLFRAKRMCVLICVCVCNERGAEGGRESEESGQLWRRPGRRAGRCLTQGEPATGPGQPAG